MKIKLVILTLITVCLLLMLPSTTAFLVIGKTGGLLEEQNSNSRFPILNRFVYLVAYFRYIRAKFWFALAIEDWGTYDEDSFVYKRAMIIDRRLDFWYDLWSPFAQWAGWW